MQMDPQQSTRPQQLHQQPQPRVTFADSDVHGDPRLSPLEQAQAQVETELRQTGLAIDYFLKYEQCAKLLRQHGWTEDALIQHAYKGLRSDIRWVIQNEHTTFSSVRELMRKACAVESRLPVRDDEWWAVDIVYQLVQSGSAVDYFRAFEKLAVILRENGWSDKSLVFFAKEGLNVELKRALGAGSDPQTVKELRTLVCNIEARQARIAEERVAAEEIQQLVQSGTVIDYFAEFEKRANILRDHNWGDPELVFFARQGLRPQLRYEISANRTKPSTVDELYYLAHEIESRPSWPARKKEIDGICGSTSNAV